MSGIMSDADSQASCKSHPLLVAVLVLVLQSK